MARLAFFVPSEAIARQPRLEANTIDMKSMQIMSFDLIKVLLSFQGHKDYDPEKLLLGPTARKGHSHPGRKVYIQ
jgi:hypothetical protein